MAAVTEGSVEWIDRDLEARRHLWRGLMRMSEAGRLAFLKHCCRAASCRPDDKVGVSVTVDPRGHYGTAFEVFTELCYAAVIHGFSLLRACEEMELWLKKGVGCGSPISGRRAVQRDL